MTLKKLPCPWTLALMVKRGEIILVFVHCGLSKHYQLGFFFVLFFSLKWFHI